MDTNRKYTEEDLRTVIRLDDFARHVILNSLERGFYPCAPADWSDSTSRNAMDLARFAGLTPAFDRALDFLETAKDRADAKGQVAEKRREIRKHYDKAFVAVGRRDGFRCRHCGATGIDLEIDHILPVSLGGSNHLDNLQILCHSCNAVKSDHLP